MYIVQLLNLGYEKKKNLCRAEIVSGGRPRPAPPTVATTLSLTMFSLPLTTHPFPTGLLLIASMAPCTMPARLLARWSYRHPIADFGHPNIHIFVYDAMEWKRTGHPIHPKFVFLDTQFLKSYLKPWCELCARGWSVHSMISNTASEKSLITATTIDKHVWQTLLERHFLLSENPLSETKICV